MGNKNGSEFGGIIVRTEKLLYISGEVVKGVIYLNVTKPDFQGKVVLFQIVGKESNKFQRSSGDRRRIYKAKSKFYDRRVVVHEFSDQNVLGQFAFPFEVQLPFNLPGSFMYTNKATALITYKFKAKFISTNKSINPIKHKQEVTIREPALMQLQVQITQNQGNLQTWCCVDQGTTQIWAKTDKNYYSPREYVKFQYDIDNTQCKLDISRIEINFLNKLELTHKNDIKCILYLKKNVLIHEGLKSQSRIQMDKQRVGEIQMIDMNDQSKIIYPTINGYLVKSTYLLQIKPIFSGCICCEGSNPPPVVYLPLTLLEVNQQQIYSDPINQPIDWSPYQFDVYQINDSNYQIDQGNQNMKKMIQPMNID